MLRQLLLLLSHVQLFKTPPLPTHTQQIHVHVKLGKYELDWWILVTGILLNIKPNYCTSILQDVTIWRN